MRVILRKFLAESACLFITGLVVICPLLLAVVCALPNFFGGWGLVWDGHLYDFYFLPDIKRHLPGGVALACIWGVCFALFCRSRFFTDARHLPLKLFLVTLVSRGALALTVGQFASPVSDFAFAWDRACTGCFNPEYSSHLLCPTWMAFSMFERFWVLLFGPNMGVGLLCVSVYDAITAAMIYCVAFYMFSRRVEALLAAGLYIFYPSSIAYSLTTSPEHMGIACFMMMAVLFAKLVLEEMSVKRRLSLLFAAGLIAGLGNSVKPIFVLYATGMVICLCVAALRDKRFQWKHFFYEGCLFMLFVMVEMVVFSCVLRCSECVFGVSFRTMDPTPHCLCVGLNRQGEGQIHVGALSRTWHTLIRDGVPYQEATRMTYEAIVKDWQSHAADIVPFFMKKSVWAWQDDNIPFFYVMTQLGAKVRNDFTNDKGRGAVQKLGSGNPGHGIAVDEHDSSAKMMVIDYVWQSIQTAGFVWYFLTMVLAAVGVVLYGKRNQGNIVYVCNCLFVLGYCGLIALGEAQSRYKCLVMPYVFILAAPLITKLVIKDQKSS